MRGFVVLLLAACSEHGQSPNDGAAGDGKMFVPCTPQSQSVTGTSLLFDQVETTLDFISCSGVIGNSTDRDTVFGGNPPSALAAVDFGVDRIFLEPSNPAVRFFVETGSTVIVGTEQQCVGAAPTCLAFIVHGTTRDVFGDSVCPYQGPDPCLAP